MNITEQTEKNFQASWHTIPEFGGDRRKCMYRKENMGGGTDGCRAGGGKDPFENLHVLARARYILEREKQEESVRIVLRITADDYYKLYVNGRLAGQGPAPAYPEHYYYNEIDITSYLHEGNNVFAVHLYYQGLVNRVWNSGDGRFGMACEIEEHRPEGNRIFELPWNYCISEAYSGEATGYDTQFLENFDSRKWEDGWKEEDFDDRNWRPMIPAPWLDHKCVLQPVKMVDVYRRRPEVLKKTPYGWFADMGEEVTGALFMWAESERDAGKVIVRYAEELEEDGENVRYDMRCGCRYEETWTLRRGACCLEPYDYKGFRYIQIICGPGVAASRIEVQIRHYPMDDTLCALHSGSPVLDRIFRICCNGVKYGTQEGFLDCPTREKGQYLGDAVISAHTHVWLTGDTAMLRKCVAQFAWTAEICPGLMAVAPGAYMQEIADFSLLFGELLLLDYQFTGDKAFLKTYYPAMRGMIQYFRQYEREDGLLEQVSGKWNLVDWPENLRDGYDFPLSRPAAGPGCHNVINALYAGAVRTLERIEKILNLPDEKRSGQIREAFLAAFYNRESGLFRDSTRSRHSALHSNLYPLYFGLCPEGGAGRIADFLEEKGLCCGVMAGYFYLKALAAAGRYDAVYRALVNETQHGWANMLREGATACWEAWGKDQKWNTSLCHPWASGPVPVIIEDIAGIRPDPEARFGFRFEPHIPEELEGFRLKFILRGKAYTVEKARGKLPIVF